MCIHMNKSLPQMSNPAVQGTLDILLELDWIKPKGRRQSPGRPLTWGTTDKFLEHFNFKDLKELPTLKEINQLGIEEKRG